MKLQYRAELRTKRLPFPRFSDAFQANDALRAVGCAGSFATLFNTIFLWLAIAMMSGEIAANLFVLNNAQSLHIGGNEKAEPLPTPLSALLNMFIVP